jgi:hypothetical protein
MAAHSPHDHSADILSLPTRSVRVWRVEDRLTADGVHVLIADYLAGTPKRELSERYGIGLTTVKDLLRRHGVRRSLPS